MAANCPRKRVGHLQRWLARPAVCVLLVLVSGGVVGLTLVDPERGTVAHALRFGPSLADPLIIHAVAVLDQDGGVIVLVDDGVESFGSEISDAITSDRPLLSMYYSSRGHSFGVLRRWSRTTEYRLNARADEANTAWTPGREEQAAEQFVDQLVAMQLVPSQLSARLVEGFAAQQHDSLLAILHDILALTILGLTGCSLGLVAWPRVSPVLLRRRHRLACGLCPACGYDLRGIDTGLCPECGQSELPA